MNRMITSVDTSRRADSVGHSLEDPLAAVEAVDERWPWAEAGPRAPLDPSEE